MIAVGYENGDIKLFHVNGSQYLWELHVKDGICSIEFNNDKLLASTLSGAYLIDIATGKASEIQVQLLLMLENMPINPSNCSLQLHYGLFDICHSKHSTLALQEVMAI